MKKAVFLMEPFSCPSCVKKIEGALSRAKGVQQVKVLFHSSKVRVEFDESVVEANELQELIVKLGYPVLNQKVS
ncbi:MULTISPECIES: heavy-metal-associated domain-containing protein [unclassified Sporosarcina]|uniref:heavy-metal-associated domain-containing protein n=1 Tax=unclassified Sporosarcina TaxID=2647733 RepID=UPI000C167710|nr:MULTISPECIES: heavy metal-associated domain-containing protein [unclassified Sporosarcina]PIC98348.1 heavy metal-binding protein [Sporosarcina sp. P29]PID05948.1 heavy metal-binding protein [Sporosarcina sp. P30]PID09142.1 heavy metal-binding protein [Sporosarcina sp. P31]PID12440.1 heavy metal-binding protein [Sporosarcina sp. P32b]